MFDKANDEAGHVGTQTINLKSDTEAHGMTQHVYAQNLWPPTVVMLLHCKDSFVASYKQVLGTATCLHAVRVSCV